MATVSTSTFTKDGYTFDVLKTPNFEYHFWNGEWSPDIEDEPDCLYNEDRRFARAQNKLPELRDLLEDREIETNHLDQEMIPAHAVWQGHIKGLLEKVGALVDELVEIGGVLEKMGGLIPHSEYRQQKDWGS